MVQVESKAKSKIIKGTKPSAEQVKLIQEQRRNKKTFLESLTCEERTCLQKSTPVKLDKKTNQQEQLELLSQHKIKNHKLVDIGINLHTKSPSVLTEHLNYAAAAGKLLMK